MSKPGSPRKPRAKFPDRDVCAELERNGSVVLNLSDDRAWEKLAARYRAIRGEWRRGEKLPAIQLELR